MRKLLFLGLLFSFLDVKSQDTTTIVSSPPDWIFAVMSNNRDSKWYVKSEYVSKEYGEIKVWVKSRFQSETYNKKVYKNGELRQLWVASCSKKQIQLRQSVMYDSKGNVLSSEKIESYELEWVDVVPDSIGEAIVNKICELFN